MNNTNIGLASYAKSRALVGRLQIKPDHLINLYKTNKSGQVITRKKIDTITGVYHPGIVIGEDDFGQTWVAHNHYEHNRPVIQPLQEFSKGVQTLPDPRKVIFSNEAVVSRALNEVNSQKQYNKVNYNCQTFVNVVTRNEKASESVDRIGNNLLFFGLLASILGLTTGSKHLTRLGVGIAVLGAGGKALSRI